MPGSACSVTTRFGSNPTVLSVSDLPAGTYTLKVMVSAGSENQGFTKEIVVAEMPGGRSDDSLDLGTITFQISPKK